MTRYVYGVTGNRGETAADFRIGALSLATGVTG